MGPWAFDPLSKHQIVIGFDFQNRFGTGNFLRPILIYILEPKPDVLHKSQEPQNTGS
jgi:hypothetical protein